MTNIIPGKRLDGRVAGLFMAKGKDFVTEPVAALDLGFDGIAGDFHQGLTRKSGGREPWYPRGTEMRNERQISIVAADELRQIADAMGVAEVRPEWIGANMVVEGIARLSMLPPRTLLFIEGVTLRIDGQNAPCRLAGRSVADHLGLEKPDEAALAFRKAAERLRGLVAWVEKPGRMEAGTHVVARLPEQWIY